MVPRKGKMFRCVNRFHITAAAAPDVALYFNDIASVAFNVGSDPLDFGDLLCYLLPHAF